MTTLAVAGASPQVQISNPNGEIAPHRERRFGSWWIFVLALAVRLPAMWAPPFVRHPWRQAQTAFTIREFARNGIDVLHPRVPVVGRPWVLIYEFPLFQAIAAALMRLGASAETTGRWVALACFFATAHILGRLTHDVLAPSHVRFVQKLGRSPGSWREWVRVKETFTSPDSW